MYIIPASPMQGGLPPHLFPLWIRFWFSCLFNDSQRALIFIAFQSFLLLPFVDQRIGSTAWIDRVDIYRDIPNHSPVRDILQDHPLFVLLFSLLISCVILLVFYSILHSFLHFSGAICDPTGLLLFTPRNADNHFLTSQLFKLCLDITKKHSNISTAMATALDALTSSQPLASSAFPPRHPASQSALSATASAELVPPSAASSSAYWTAASRPSWSLTPNHTNVYPQDAMALNPNVSPTHAMSQPYDLAPFPPTSLSAQHQQHYPQQQHQYQQHPMANAMLAPENPHPHSIPPADSSSTSSTSPPSPSFASTDRYAPMPGANSHPLSSCPRQPPPWPSYSLPAMNGPVRTNIHNPNGPVTELGSMSSAIIPSNFNSGYLASMQQMYGGPSPPHASPGPTQDRPFRCDQCPQSFNRNHDLKRHKRIHLSVKPFPCTHCDKSFSRKDALKVGLDS